MSIFFEKNDALFPVQWKLQFDVTTIGFWLNAEIWLKQWHLPLYLVLPYVTDYTFKLQKWIKFHGFLKLRFSWSGLSFVINQSAWKTV